MLRDVYGIELIARKNARTLTVPILCRRCIDMRKLMVLSVVFSFLMTGFAYADGVIVIPAPPRDRAFIPLSRKYHHVEVDIDNQIATTKVDQVFINENDRELEGIYIFPIPEGASISGFTMYVDGKPVASEVLERKKARQIYEDIVRRMKDPALL